MSGLPREIYLPAPDGDTAQWMNVHYMDRDGTREEVLRLSSASDTYVDWERRISTDNGRNFGPTTGIPDVVQRLPGGGLVTYPGGCDVDPVTGIRYELRMRRFWPGMEPFTFVWENHQHPFTDHCYVVEHHPDGTSREIFLRFEDGPDWNPDDPFAPDFAAANQAYFGNGFAFTPDGSVYLPLVCHRTAGPDGHEAGVVLMRRRPEDATWGPSNCVHLQSLQSSRGLLEPDVAACKDGRLLVICRGSSTDVTPGHKWVTTSDDGGRTLAPVRELTWDDGTSFYSPSSIHRLQRSRRNGRLYWCANITEAAPDANGPRYPLYLAEIDEERIAVRRSSLVLVDDRREEDSKYLQLSNFSLLEDIETDRFEIYITRIGSNADQRWHAGVDRYVFEPPAP